MNLAVAFLGSFAASTIYVTKIVGFKDFVGDYWLPAYYVSLFGALVGGLLSPQKHIWCFVVGAGITALAVTLLIFLFMVNI